MCWFRRCAYLSVFFLLSCTGQREDTELIKKAYFDLAGYFKAHGEALSQKQAKIRKTIVKNGRSESKTLQIGDWEKELSLFVGSDINKPAWTPSYETTQEGDTLTYRALDPDLRTQLIRISGSGNAVAMVYIKNQEENALYKSEEELFYYPDSLYRIDKRQDVRVIGINEYRIEGRLKE